ncbi:creatininase family protein [Paenibacillus ginsengarvi]|uniref:Creatininase family protein n=1 Tax=Paenibacillus ginsengarvi TaxID=400777 RepID=A0A3B0CS04_9BACL|nr:creatininase family protein [Paenibacillus ginsengarvi]RKN86227.1 creatininase family protein [Paenibacillus ginsengarvi]
MRELPGDTPKVLWAELFPSEFKSRLQQCPLVYLPLGLCEPHGQISAFGLDTFKAEHLCKSAAATTGGIVAPTMGYHVHEVGPSARFLEQNVGENNPHMTSVPSFIFYHFYLYQLRAFYNAGFQHAIVLSGHGGAHLHDLQKITNLFMERVNMRIWFGTDFDLVQGTFDGDHAGKYEISALMHIRPDLVDMSRKSLEAVAGAGGRLAVGPDAEEASREYGEQIVQACEAALTRIASNLNRQSVPGEDIIPLSIELIEEIWQQIVSSSESSPAEWGTLQPRAGQQPVSELSRWKQHERIKMQYGSNAKAKTCGRCACKACQS